MRIASWLLLVPLIFVLSACNRGDDFARAKGGSRPAEVPEEKAVSKNPAPPPPEAERDGKIQFAKKGGKGIVGNVRGAAWRTERRAELKSLGLSYNQFCDEYKGGARTYDNFLKYISRDGPIYEAVKEGYYQINMKAQPNSNSVVAYERDLDNQGHLAAKGDGSVDYVSLEELRQALGK